MKKYLLLMILFVLLTGCSQELTEDDLIGGNWIAVAGYEDDEATRDPNCYPLQEGIEFLDEDNPYVESYKKILNISLVKTTGVQQ